MNKKEEGKFLFGVYGLFLSIKTACMMETMMIKANNPTIAGIKYVSATDWYWMVEGSVVV